MRKIFIIVVGFISLLSAEDGLNKDVNKTLQDLELRYIRINKEIQDTKSIWLNAYNNYTTYINLSKSLKKMQRKIKRLLKKRQTKERRDFLKLLKDEEKTLKKQLELLPSRNLEPFNDLLKVVELPEKPDVTNPLAIFMAFSFIKTITALKESNLDKIEELERIQALISEKSSVLLNLVSIYKSQKWAQKYQTFQKELNAFNNALQVLRSTGLLYAQRIDVLKFQVSSEIESQIKSFLNLLTIIIILIGFTLLLKLGIKKYLKDNERFYVINKIINFLNFFIIMMILLVTYINNVSYLVTVLGFASAGIAIALKDWFMSLIGWLVIVTGGAIHVGDRIKCSKNGMEYVGDVLDISILRITILEDVTLTSTKERRAGRIVFIPNNYIFTDMIASYTHYSLRTVWDCVDIVITFTSNHKKASSLAKEITRKHAKGYTDMARKQLNRLRNQYSLKNTNVEPRVFTLIQPNGISVSSWYLTSSYATLTLRSKISVEIVDAFNKEDDISIAYPTQTISLESKQKNDIPISSNLIKEI